MSVHNFKSKWNGLYNPFSFFGGCSSADGLVYLGVLKVCDKLKCITGEKRGDE